MIVAVQQDGPVRLFMPTGELALSFDAGHQHPVTTIAVPGSHEEIFVATADAGGIIRVHKINVRQRRLSKDQKQGRRNSTDEKISQFLGVPVDVTYTLSNNMTMPLADNGEPLAVKSLATGSQSGNKFFVAADVAGNVHTFQRNGTYGRKLNLSIAVDSLYVHLSNLMFRGGD